MRAKLFLSVLVGLGCAMSVTAASRTYISDATLPLSADIPQFGVSVAISGDEALVAAPKQSGMMFGSVTLYRKSSGSWSEETTFAYPEPAHDFSSYVGLNGIAINGDTVAIGISSANSSDGIVEIFERRDTVGWVLSQTLSVPSPSAFESFGASVALSDSSLIVGAPGHGGTGAAYVFVHDRLGWNLQSTLSASDAASGDTAGFSVAIDGDLAVLGAPHADSDKGAGYVFSRSGTKWSEIWTLSSGDGVTGEQFGAAVALSGGTAAVGSPEWNAGNGAVYVYEGPAFSVTAARLSETARNFGSAVRLSGGRMIVGAIGSNAAYTYTRGGTEWHQRGAFSGISTSRLGNAVAISGSQAIIGALGDDHAYIVHDDQIFGNGFE
jgi:FG-GAP repeat